MSNVPDLIAGMTLPVIAAPMFTVSNPILALATCAEGMMGSFPAHTTRSGEELEDWLISMAEGGVSLAEEGIEKVGPYGVNLVVSAGNERLDQDLDLCIKHKALFIVFF